MTPPNLQGWGQTSVEKRPKERHKKKKENFRYNKQQHLSSQPFSHPILRKYSDDFL